jgi:hypothetical protein
LATSVGSVFVAFLGFFALLLLVTPHRLGARDATLEINSFMSNGRCNAKHNYVSARTNCVVVTSTTDKGLTERYEGEILAASEKHLILVSSSRPEAYEIQTIPIRDSTIIQKQVTSSTNGRFGM